MAKLYNLARMSTATTGTGTITLGSAVSGYLTFALAGVANADVVDYAIKDGSNSEIGTGTYTSSGTTLTRTVTKSTNSNAAISLSGTAEVFISPRAETLNDASHITSGTLDPARIPATSDTVAGGIEIAVQSEMETATDTTRAVTPGRQQYHPSAAKVWAKITVSGGVPAVSASYNLTGITDSGAGIYDFTIATDFSSGNYSALVSSDRSGPSTTADAFQSALNNYAAGSFRVYTFATSAGGGPIDHSTISVVAFGDQ